MNVNIRNYYAKDAQDIAEINFLFNLAYQYNGDYKPENIFCAEIDNRVVATGYLEPTESCEYLDKEGKDSNYVHRFILETDSHGYEQLEQEIFERILDRATQIKKSYPHKKIQISHACEHTDLESIDFLFSKGFYHSLNYFIMKRDLTLPMPEYSLNHEIEIKRWAMGTEAEKELYLQAEEDSSGESWSKARLNWFMAGSEWDTITAFHHGKPISSCMTWGISSDRSATEQIFTHPDWRRKGVARATIIETMRFLRDEKQKNEATLGVVGSNQAAIRLYKSLGYELIDIHLLMVKDIV
ncbi:GNAT family N-acetyltransferase [Paenibacillus sp. N3/727]|uniref:GNAT family N-acetyltransferase n=1 Tax=Paenibacillus sp. N3/727 TaxID=2925845 RepID=UPI001F535AC2|nr:GNAT family N-acetyltransferase [Paenibacillus sp. N3/727]UNK16944.1 GNAT family N-acetyltransferase [Paenibacillus sp. N3/727]